MKTNKTPQRVIGFALCSIIFILFSGCATPCISGIKPIYPRSGWEGYPAPVNSLQPELKWEDSAVSKKYDLAIWDSLCGQRRKIIYEKTALSGTSHKVEIVLKPDRLYYWSVRETGLETWSTQTPIFFPLFWPEERTSDKDMFIFYTPKTK